MSTLVGMPLRLHSARLLLSLCLIALCLDTSASAHAQAPTPPPAPAKTAVNPDGSITFRYTNAGAKKVIVSTDALPKPAALVRDDNGVWSFTTPPLTPEHYGYSFVVDGVGERDPLNPEVRPNLVSLSSDILLPATPAAPSTRFRSRTPAAARPRAAPRGSAGDAHRKGFRGVGAGGPGAESDRPRGAPFLALADATLRRTSARSRAR